MTGKDVKRQALDALVYTLDAALLSPDEAGDE